MYVYIYIFIYIYMRLYTPTSQSLLRASIWHRVIKGESQHDTSIWANPPRRWNFEEIWGQGFGGQSTRMPAKRPYRTPQKKTSNLHYGPKRSHKHKDPANHVFWYPLILGLGTRM